MKTVWMCVASLAVSLLVVSDVFGYPMRRSYAGPKYEKEDPIHPMPYVEVHNATYRGAGPLEEARAMCSVKTQEINATANATITKKLYGVATSREMNMAFRRLELIVSGQMQQIWQSLNALQSQLAGNPKPIYPSRRSAQIRFKPGRYSYS